MTHRAAGIGEGCACEDYDGDGDVDMVDFAGFQRAVHP